LIILIRFEKLKNTFFELIARGQEAEKAKKGIFFQLIARRKIADKIVICKLIEDLNSQSCRLGTMSDFTSFHTKNPFLT
jgi:hypothetical protein